MDPPPHNDGPDERKSNNSLEHLSEANTSNAAGSASALISSPSSSRSSTEPCRLSWFLVRNDAASAAKHGEYCIIHAMDIINEDQKDIFLFNVVHYNFGKDTVSGQLLAAADQIELVEANMQEWKKVDHLKSAVTAPHLLVQYRSAPNRLVHRVVHKNDVTLTVLPQPQNNGREIFIKDGNGIFHVGYVLTRSNNIDQLQNELIKLKGKCFETIRSTFPQSDNVEKDVRKEPQDDTWLLLQYSHSVSDCVYIIMRYKDTQKLESNMYPGLQAYLTEENTIYQAMILHKSLNEVEVLSVLNNLASSCLLSVYPPMGDTEFRNPELVKYERPNLHEHNAHIAANARKSDIMKCEIVTKCIETEVAYVFQLLDHIDRNSQRMVDVLRQLRELTEETSSKSGDI